METSQGWVATERYFRDYLRSSGKSERTTRTYCSNLLGFWRWCSRFECTPYLADRTLIRQWIGERLQKVSAQRVNNDLSAIKLFYAWLRDTRDRDDNPAEGISVKRPKTMPTPPLPETDLVALLASCDSERDRLIVLVLAATGMRISEMAALEAEHIDWPAGIIKVKGKGEKERPIKPDATVLNRLHAYLGMFPSGPVWLSQRGNPLSAHQLRKILYEIAARAKVPDVHPHRLRSTFATCYMDEHGDIQALQGMMGHESIETTARYSEFTRLKRGMDQMSRLSFVSRLAG